MFHAPSARAPFRPRVEILEDRLALSTLGPTQTGTSLTGIWVNQADQGECEIVQVGTGGRARFINEWGDRAWGTVRGDRVVIPDWQDGSVRGLVGRLRGDRIVWPDGNYWHRAR